MANPMNKLNVELEMRKAQLGQMAKDLTVSEKELEDIKKQYENLINDYVVSENALNESNQAIENMCYSCSQKSTEFCNSCELHKVSVEYGFLS
jgi:archaellum component FlaC